MLAAVLQKNMILSGNNTKHVKILKLVKGTYHFLEAQGQSSISMNKLLTCECDAEVSFQFLLLERS